MIRIDPKYTTRQEIFDDLANGKIEPNEAEERAAKLGVGPLREVPSADEFDPSTCTHWTLPMVIAWIVWRTMDRVREQWDDYRKAAPFWSGRSDFRIDDATGEKTTYTSYHLDTSDKATAFDLMLVEAFSDATEEGEKSKLLTVKMARLDLWRKLASDVIQASAIPCGEQHPRLIQSHEWRYLEIIEIRGEDVLRYEHEPLSQVYKHVSFDPIQVVKTWPAPKMTALQKRDAKRRCLAWFEDEIRRNFSRPSMTKPEFLRRAKADFGIGKPAGEGIWDDALTRLNAAAWRAAGRRRKN